MLCLLFIITISHSEARDGFARHLVKSNSKIAIALISVGTPAYGKNSVLNKLNYATLNGYDFIITENSYDEAQPIAWSKIGFLKEIMQMYDYEWIFHIDLDAFILNPSISLDKVIADAIAKFEEERNDKDLHLILNKDCNGFNGGQFFIKNSDLSAEWLTRAYESRSDSSIEKVFFWWEQAVLKHILENDEKFEKIAVFIDQSLINSYPDDF